MIQIDKYRYKAEEGCFIIHKKDGFIMGENICLGENDSIDNYQDYVYTLEEYDQFYNPTQPSLKETIYKKVEEITMYDRSEHVNSFKVNDVGTWLDKTTRVGLMNSIATLKELGKDKMTLWLNNTPYVIEVDYLRNLLIELEDYAMKCYNQTCIHIAHVSSLTDYNEIVNYDYTKNYPNKLVFTIL